MTDKDRLSAIKTEIERRKEINKDFDHSDAYMRGVMACYSEVLAIFEFDEFKEEPVSEDLEEAAKKEFPTDTPILLAPDVHHISNGEALRWAYEKGANWQKEQMMKDAVDGTVFTQLEDGKIMVRSHYFKSEKITYLDKVKVIIIKED